MVFFREDIESCEISKTRFSNLPFISVLKNTAVDPVTGFECKALL